MAAAWVQLVVLVVFCSTTIDDVLATTDGDLESSLQGPPDKPINVRFESVNFNHTLRWDLAPNHDNSTLFTVQYIGSGHRDSSPSPEDWQEKAKCINITGLCCVLLNELGTDGNWWARVRALNPYGTSDWAESKVFEPFEDTRIGVPDLEVLQAKTDRLTLRVKAPKTPFYNSNGRRMRMSHFYSRITWLITYQEVGSSFPPGEKETTDKDVVLNHLYPGKHYCITVRGRYMDEVGETGRICADTQEDAPSAGARSLSFSVDGCTKYPLRNIRLTWQPPAEEKWNGKLQEYKISYKDVGASYEEMTHSMVPGDVTNFTIRDLSASEEYVVDVAACTSAGCSERRALHNMLRVPPLKTDISPYAPNVSVAPLSSTSMQVSWSPLEDACVQGYMVQYDPEVAPVRVSSATTVNLTGLVPGTEYHVCVKARLPSADVEFGECARGLGVFARTEPTTADPSTLVQTVLPILAVVVLLVVLCVLVLWMRGSPFLSISKINIVLPPVLVEIKETKDSTSLEPISSSWNKESMDDLDTIRTNVIRQKSKFVKSLQNLPDTLSLDDDVFQTDEKKTLLSWKSDKDLVVKVVISQQKGDSGSDKNDEPSSPTSTDSGNISGPCSLITDSGGDEDQSNVPVETYRLDSPVSFQKKNPFDSHVQASSDSPRPSQEIRDPGQAVASWPDNQTTSSEIDSYVRATDDTFEDDADEGFMPEGCKGQSNPYVLAESLPLLAPPFTQGFIRPNPHVQPTIAPPTNPPAQMGVTGLPVPNSLLQTSSANSPPTQSMSSGSSIDPYVVSATPLLQLPVPRPAPNTVGAIDSPSSSSTSSIDPYVQAGGRPTPLPPPPAPRTAPNTVGAVDSPSSSSTSSIDPYVQAGGGPRGWQNPPASSSSMSSGSGVDPYIRAGSRQAAPSSNGPSAAQRPPGGLHRPRGPPQTQLSPTNNLNSSSDTRRDGDYQDPWVAR